MMCRGGCVNRRADSCVHARPTVVQQLCKVLLSHQIAHMTIFGHMHLSP